MEYFDEILNVDAYLRMRMQRNLQRSQEIAEGYEKINNDINELTGRADAAFMQIQELARQLGVDISEQESDMRMLRNGQLQRDMEAARICG